MTAITNAPESEALTSAQAAIFDNARGAAEQLVKSAKITLDLWIVVGRGVVLAREIADHREHQTGAGHKGRKTFWRLLEQQGLTRVVRHKATASRLEAIMANLPKVIEWHERLTDGEKAAWNSPGAIYEHCHLFKKPKPPKGERPLTKLEQTEMANVKLHEELDQLKRNGPGDRFNPNDTAEDISTMLVGMFSPSKAEDIAKRTLAKLAKLKRSGKSATPKGPKPKTGKTRPANGALEWQETDGIGGVACFNAQTEGGEYDLRAMAHFPSMKFIGYDISFQPTGVKFENRDRLRNGVKTAEQAKTVAQAHYDKQRP